MIGKTNSVIGDKINGGIVNKVIATGESIAKGDFVYRSISTATGNVVSPTANTVGNNDANRSFSIGISSSRYILFYFDSGALKACIGNVSGETSTLDTANAITIEASGGAFISACKIDNNRVFLCYRKQSNSGMARIITIDEEGLLTAGTAYQFSSIVIYYPYVELIGPNKVLIAFRKSSNGCLVCGTIDGTTITFGSNVYENFTIGQYGLQKFYLLGEDKILFMYRTGNPSINARVISINDTALTLNTALTITSSPATSDYYVCGFLYNSTTAYIIYKTSTNTNCYYKRLTISDTTITSGSETLLISTYLIMLQSLQVSFSNTINQGLLYDSDSATRHFYTVDITQDVLVITTTGSASGTYWSVIFTLMEDNKTVRSYLTGVGPYTQYSQVFNALDNVLKYTYLNGIYGVAKTGGNAGDTIKVYVP